MKTKQRNIKIFYKKANKTPKDINKSNNFHICIYISKHQNFFQTNIFLSIEKTKILIIPVDLGVIDSLPVILDNITGSVELKIIKN